MEELDLGGGVCVLRALLFDEDIGVCGLELVEGVSDLKELISTPSALTDRSVQRVKFKNVRMRV